ncbi:MAG: ABC transporter ATP-binding protein [Pseudomonadales bacterium]|nr:ABC transporter ATP-binding protein [Pseudomonadales bacterium]
METILEIKNLAKSYGKLKAVDGISFKIPPGICFGLLGPNGAGKTTTIEMIEGIIKPSSGTIFYKEKLIDKQFRQEAGIQFQSTALMDFVTVREILKLFTSFYEQTIPVEQLAEQCNLIGFLDQYATKLSGGQRQRLLLALALINDPQILFLDEPTTGLDPQARRHFWELIESIKKQGKTIVLTTHYMDEAEALCDHLVIVDQGKIIEQGSPQELLGQHFNTVCIQIDEAEIDNIPVDVATSTQRVNHQIQIETEQLEQTLSKLIEAGVNLSSMRIRNRTLEDLFLKLTGNQLREAS